MTRISFKAVIALFTGLALLPVATAETVRNASDSFSWNSGSGKVQLLQRVDLMDQILAGETVFGTVMLNDCQENGRFEPGFRMVLQSEDQVTSLFPGFTCEPETGDVYAGQSSIVKAAGHPGLQHAEFLDLKVGELGEPISFAISLNDGMVSIDVNNMTALYPAYADFGTAFFAAAGSEGVVIFSDTDEEIDSLG